MPTDTGLCSASVKAAADNRTPAFASANSGRITKLVHGRSRCSARASGEIASSGTAPRRLGIGDGGRREPDHHARERRRHARRAHGHPHPDPEPDVDQRGPDAEPRQHEHRRDQDRRDQERHGVQLRRVEDRDHHERQDVVDDRQGEDERPEAGRRVPRGERQDAQRERDVGGHRDPPAASAVPAGVDRQVDQRGDRHPADRGDHGERRRPPVAQLPAQELPLDLQADHQEEQRHQPVVDPMAEVVRDRPPAGSERERRAPQPVVGVADRRVDPDERHERGDHEQDGARGGFLEELLQRANHAPVQWVGRCHASRSCRPDFPAHLRNRHMLPAGQSTRVTLFTGSSHGFGCCSAGGARTLSASCQTVDTHPRLPASSPRTSSSVGWLLSRLWCWASCSSAGTAAASSPILGGSPKPADAGVRVRRDEGDARSRPATT